MQIEVSIPRPGMLLLVGAAVSGWALALQGGDGAGAGADVAAMVVEQPAQEQTVEQHAEEEAVEGTGGNDMPAAIRYAVAEERARHAREEQQVLQNKEEILRYQLEQLQQERIALGDDIDEKLEEEFRRSTRLLVELIQDEHRAEQFLETAMNQMWEASERARVLTADTQSRGPIALSWPVEPAQGISAYFLDAAYEQRFKMKHYAIDIPVPQMSEVYAAAGGVVKDVIDHGLGFNYVTIEHPGGYSTLYGHLTKFAVQKGQQIYAGDLIGYSGGRPGTPGAGMSTGPHLHFGFYVNGAPANALDYLEAKAGVQKQ